MKSFSILISFYLGLILFSCNSTSNSSIKTQKLFIITTTAIKSGQVMNKTETVSEITENYFEVSLSSQTTGGYLAQKDIIEPIPGEPFKWVFLTISQKDGKKITFMTTTEFLNYMSAHGYEMVTQIPNQYGGDYTFKRKI